MADATTESLLVLSTIAGKASLSARSSEHVYAHLYLDGLSLFHSFLL